MSAGPLYSPGDLPIAEPLTRPEVDRVRRISLRLGGLEPVGAVGLADEIVRLHRVCREVWELLQERRDSIALDLLIAEVHESWERPLDCGPAFAENRTPIASAIVADARRSGAPGAFPGAPDFPDAGMSQGRLFPET